MIPTTQYLLVTRMDVFLLPRHKLELLHFNIKNVQAVEQEGMLRQTFSLFIISYFLIELTATWDCNFHIFATIPFMTHSCTFHIRT